MHVLLGALRPCKITRNMQHNRSMRACNDVHGSKLLQQAELRAGWHPLSAAVVPTFIPNDAHFTLDKDRILIVTGEEYPLIRCKLLPSVVSAKLLGCL